MIDKILAKTPNGQERFKVMGLLLPAISNGPTVPSLPDPPVMPQLRGWASIKAYALARIEYQIETANQQITLDLSLLQMVNDKAIEVISAELQNSSRKSDTYGW